MATSAPFGNPDGSRSDITEVLEDFVEFDRHRFGDGLGIASDDLSVRVIVGVKGSGKTVYLRRLQDAASRNASVYTDMVRQEPPPTTAIVKFCEVFPPPLLDEMWHKLWQCAILGAVVSHALFDASLRNLVPSDLREQLEEYVPLLLDIRTPISAYDQVARIINSSHTRNAFEKYLEDPRWPELEYWIQQILPSLPPIYLFLDSIDEKYGNAPMHWLRCQLGLFYRTMYSLRDPRLGGRLHIVISIRDHVLASVFRGEHQQRYRGEPHIRTLDWNYAAVEHLLSSKIARLDPPYFVNPAARGDSLLKSWLGHQTIYNVVRGVEESITDYLIRHTRLSPRDLVGMGNELCKEVARARAAGMSQVPQEWIRRCVSDVARMFGNEQIAICANQIASSSMPTMAAGRGFVEVYTGDSEYVRGFDDKIKGVIAQLGKDRFAWTKVEEVDEFAKSELGETSDLLSVLWQNRLIGYRHPDDEVSTVRYFSERFWDSFNLPENRAEYVLHPCLIDSVGLEVIGQTPAIQRD